MNLNDLLSLPSLTLLTPPCDAQVTCAYCGDLLSHVMGEAPALCAWVTVMNNVNTIAVATLADVSCVVLASGIQPSDEMLLKAAANGIAVLSSPLPVFQSALMIHEAVSAALS